MKVAKIGHAGIAVRSREVTCLMDPVLVDPFSDGVLA